MSFKNLIPFEEISKNSSNFIDIDARPSWEEVFGNDNPLNLEIGFGVGNFIIEMGIREPNENPETQHWELSKFPLSSQSRAAAASASSP